MRVVVLVLLAVDGVLCAVAAALLLPSYIDAVWVPLSAVIAGLVNTALVWAAMQWTAVSPTGGTAADHLDAHRCRAGAGRSGR